MGSLDGALVLLESLSQGWIEFKSTNVTNELT